MAVFDHTIFSRGAASRNAEKNRMFDMLSGSMDKYKKDELLKDEKLKEEKKAALDPQYVIQQKLLGKPTTPEQDASLKAFDINETKKMGVDPVSGRPFKTRSSVYDMLNGGSPQQPLDNNQPAMDGNMGFDVAQKSPAPAPMLPTGFDVAGDGAYNIADEGSLPPIVEEPYASNTNMIQPELTQGMSPRTRQMAEEEAMKANINLQAEEMKLKRDIQKAEPQVIETMRSIDSDTQFMDKTIDDAISKVSGYTAGKGSLLSFVPGSPSKDLEGVLNTIRADSAFSTLTELKERGGTLGAISQSELTLLESLKGNIDQAQSPEQLKKALRAYKKQRQFSLNKVKREYERVYGKNPEAQLLKSDDDLSQYTTEQLEAMLNGN